MACSTCHCKETKLIIMIIKTIRKLLKTMEGNNLIMLYVTCPDEKVALEIANHLVTEKLAACCNIVPGVKSVYVWEGKTESSSEHLMLIKTS